MRKYKFQVVRMDANGLQPKRVGVYDTKREAKAVRATCESKRPGYIWLVATA